MIVVYALLVIAFVAQDSHSPPAPVTIPSGTYQTVAACRKDADYLRLAIRATPGLEETPEAGSVTVKVLCVPTLPQK